MKKIDNKKHWEQVYQDKDHRQASWYQAYPTISLDLILKHSNQQNSIIDVGCGASVLVDCLLQNNYQNITLLDISIKSLDIVKNRINNNKVEFINSDILLFNTDRKFEIWHDRAVLHFLTEDLDVKKYAQTANNIIKVGGCLVISVFAPNDAKKCSNLDVRPYNKKQIQKLFVGWNLLGDFCEVHKTPSNSEQKFNYFVLQKQG